MAHFITGLYYFTGFQIFLIIATGFIVGQALVSIYDLVQAIRRHQAIKPKIYILLPWLIVSIILLLSPVYSSNLGSVWMLIFAVIEILAAVLTRKIFSRHQQMQTDDEQLNTEASSADDDFTNNYDGEHYNYNPGVSRNSKSEDDKTDVSDEPKKSQEAAVSQPTQSREPASQQPISVPLQQANVVSQAQSTVSSAASAASQPVSQAAKSDEDDMDKLFDYNENTDAELAELAEEAKERQEKAKSDQAKIAKRLSEMKADHDKAN